MSTIVTIQSTDLITNSRADINSNFAALNADKIETSVLDTDTTLAANSDAKIPTQKAVKAYVDAGGNVNASETTKGINEEATQTETDDGSATGATGAKLFVTPAKLAASRYSPVRSITAGATINGATLPVPVYQNVSDNEFYACDGNDTAALKFQGFAISNGTNGAAMNVQFNGVVSGWTGLTEGPYYLSDTVGTIQTTPGTYEVLVGWAISETQLLIVKGKRYASGTASFTSTTTSAITTGFRPSKVTIFAMLWESTDTVATSNGGWTASGGNDCVWSSLDASTPQNHADIDSANAWSLQRPDGTDLETGTVTSITNTGFTLSNVHNTGSNTAVIHWIAEGDI